MARGGRGLCVRCVSCERTLYGVPVTSGVEVYVLAVFRVSGVGITWPVGVRCVLWERTRCGVARYVWGSGFVRSRVFRGSVLGTAWHINRGRGLYFRCV